jgi:hypothetical protein
MSGDGNQSGDYGYDLAHEVKSYLSVSEQHHESPPPRRDRHPERDPDGDFGYDEAHEL